MNESEGTEVRVYRRALASHFTTLPNALIRNQLPVRISSVAYRLASILLSFPEQGWKTSRDELARRYFTEGVSQVQKALAELAAAGLFRRSRVRNADGTFVWTWEIADEPVFLKTADDRKTAGSTTDQNPITGQPEGEEFPQVAPLSKNHSLVSHSLVSHSVASSYTEETPSSSIPPPPSMGERPQAEEAEDTSYEDQARILLESLPNPWRLGTKSTSDLVPSVAAALSGDDGAPWPAEALFAELSRDPIGVRSPLAVLRSRLSDLPPAPVVSVTKTAPKPPWCGQCSELDRTVEDGDDRVIRCPNCHPKTALAKLRSQRSHTV